MAAKVERAEAAGWMVVEVETEATWAEVGWAWAEVAMAWAGRGAWW